MVLSVGGSASRTRRAARPTLPAAWARPIDGAVPAGRRPPGPLARHPGQGHGRLAARLRRDRVSYAAVVGRCLEHWLDAKGWRGRHLGFYFYDQFGP
jgi:hypothetical protein